MQSLKDINDHSSLHQVSQPALTHSNFNSIVGHNHFKSKNDNAAASSLSPRATATGSSSNMTTNMQQSVLDKVPKPKMSRPQSGRNKLMKRDANTATFGQGPVTTLTSNQTLTAAHNSSSHGQLRSPQKKKGSVPPVPLAAMPEGSRGGELRGSSGVEGSPNVFSRLTSGVSGLNGTQSKIKTQKKSEWSDAYVDLEGDLSSATQFQNKFRRSLVAPQSQNGARKTATDSKDEKASLPAEAKSLLKADSAAGEPTSELPQPDNCLALITASTPINPLKSLPKRKKPPRKPLAPGNAHERASLEATGQKAKVQIVDESKDDEFYEQFQKMDEGAAVARPKH